MALWLIFVTMTAAAILAVLWPLSRQRAARPAGTDVAVYRDQLEEIARDRTAGLIGEAEADAARIEVSRRLLAAADTGPVVSESAGHTFRRRAVALAGLVVVPVLATAIYLALGSPNLPSAQRDARSLAPENRSIQSLVSQVESHIERNPNDGRGWEVLAPVYLRMGRFDDAVKARRNALNLNGETAERQSDLGEALMAAANGIVTADAKAAFERALAIEPGHLKSRFFIGVAAQQDGARDKAAEIWRSMLAEAPPDAPWAPAVRQALADIGAPGPNAQDMAAASQMSEGQRTEMIRGMVDGLAAKLSQDGLDVDGWLRLLRAYMVLGERDKAQAAAINARRALASDPDKLKRVEDAVKGLGIEG